MLPLLLLWFSNKLQAMRLVDGAASKTARPMDDGGPAAGAGGAGSIMAFGAERADVAMEPPVLSLAACAAVPHVFAAWAMLHAVGAL